MSVLPLLMPSVHDAERRLRGLTNAIAQKRSTTFDLHSALKLAWLDFDEPRPHTDSYRVTVMFINPVAFYEASARLAIGSCSGLQHPAVLLRHDGPPRYHLECCER